MSAAGRPPSPRARRSPAGIIQLVGNRRVRGSCSGVIVSLDKFRFRETIDPGQIAILEAKHGHDLKEMVSWRVEQHGRRLVIRFKPGMGDFGSGNRVEVLVDRSAFMGRIESSNERFEWSIDTDVL